MPELIYSLYLEITLEFWPLKNTPFKHFPMHIATCERIVINYVHLLTP